MRPLKLEAGLLFGARKGEYWVAVVVGRTRKSAMERMVSMIALLECKLWNYKGVRILSVFKSSSLVV